MKNLLTALFCLVLATSLTIIAPIVQANNQYTGPIPGDDLFNVSNYHNLQLSPNGKILSLLEYDGNKRSITFIDVASKVLVKGIQYDSTDSVNSYYWLDDQTLYIDITINNTDLAYFIQIPKSKIPWKQQAPAITYTRHKSQGHIVGVFDAEKSMLIYSNQGNELERLSFISVSELINENFSQAKAVPNLLEDTERYYYFKQSRRLMAIQIDRDNDSYTIKYRHMDDNNWQLLYSQAADEQNEDEEDLVFRVQGFMAGNKAAILTNHNSDKNVIYEFDLTEQKFTKLLYSHAKYDIASARTNDNSDKLVSASYYDHGKRQTEYFDTFTSEKISKLNQALGNKQLNIIAQHKPSKLMVIRTSGPSDPGEYYLYDVKANEAMLIAEKYQRLKDYHFATTQTLTIEVEDGVEIEAYLTQPLDKSHQTLLVMPHGGPIGIREYNSFNREVQYYASRGFSILRVNFRGSAGFGKSFQQSGVGQFGQQIEQDITAAVNYVNKQYTFKKMCAMGASYGGYSSLMLAIKHPDDYDCVVAAYGIYDLPYLYNASNIEIEDEHREAVSDVVGEYSDKLYDVSPVYLTNKINVPILLIAGEQDNIAHFEHSSRMLLMLEAANKNVEHLFYRNTGHGHRYYSGDRHEAAYTTDYLMRTLALKPLWSNTSSNETGNETGNESHINEKLTKSLLADYKILASNYGSDLGIVRVDLEKAKYYNDLGIALNDMDSLYSAAQVHLNNLVIASPTLHQDSEKALQWLKQASDSGYAKASNKLALIYETGIYTPRNTELFATYAQKAYQQFDKDKALDSYLYARANVAWAKCLGYGEPAISPENLKQCQQLLDHEVTQSEGIVLTNNREYILNRTLVDVLINNDNRLTPAQLAPFRQLLSSQINVPLKTINVNVSNCYQKSLRVEQQVIVEKDKHIAFCFDIEGSTFSRELDDKAAVLIRLVSTDKNGLFQVKRYNLLTGKSRDNWAFDYNFDREDLIEANWKVEFYDILGNLIYQQGFKGVMKQ